MTSDRRIGAQVRSARGNRTQRDVADAMFSVGYRWSQATVWAVETGERPLRLSEAAELARILETSVDRLLSVKSESGQLQEENARLRAQVSAAREMLA